MRFHFIIMILSLGLSACNNDDSPRQNQAPTIAPISDRSIQANESSNPITINISDDSTANADLEITIESDNEVLVPVSAITVNNVGEGREIVITPTQANLGEAIITVTVTDTMQLSSSTSFILSVVTQNLSYSQFIREVFNDDANASPRDLNSRTLIQDAQDDAFSDLL